MRAHSVVASRTEWMPSRWPQMRRMRRSLAQRPLPSMMMAMCSGKGPPRSGRCGVVAIVATLASADRDQGSSRARDDLVAVGTDREHQDRRAHALLEPLHVVARLRGQVLEVAHARDVLVPA